MDRKVEETELPAVSDTHAPEIDEKELMSTTHLFKPILGQWTIEEDENNHLIGKISIKTFPVIGWTFLHVIRRLSLGLSSSYAVSGFKFRVNAHGKEIEPAHEYEAITGVLEDVPYVHHNIKGVIVNVEYLTEDRTPLDYFILKIRANNAGPVYAADAIDVDSYNNSQDRVKVEIVNKDHLICHLDVNTSLDGEVLVRYGFGYASEEDNEKYFNKFLSSSTREGWFFLSSQFSNGVLMVNGNVTEVTSGSVPYDLLELTIITDGRISPEDVVKQSFKMLHEQIPYVEEETSPSIQATGNVMYNNGYNSTTPLSKLDFPSNVINILAREGVITLGDLLNRSESSLKVLKGIGATKLSSLKAILHNLGFSLNK